MLCRDLQAPFSLPRGARLVTLVRHGAAAHACDDIDGEGRSDPPLTHVGEAQAAALARCFSARFLPGRVRSPLVITSGMRRTDSTAAPTVAALRVGPREVSALREVGLGAYEGEAFERARLDGDPLLRRAFAEERWDVLPGAESMAEFSNRVWSGLCDVADAVEPGRQALVFTHGGVIAELCRQVTGGRAFAFVGVDNASVTTLMLTADGAWVLRGFNDTAHLS